MFIDLSTRDKTILMRNLLLLILSSLFLYSCGNPNARVFEDMTLAEEELVKICLLGDLGKDTELQGLMAEALGREECHRMFFLGDLVYPSGIKSIEDPELQQKFLNYYQPLLESNPNLRINLLLGNHDHQGSPAAWRKIGEKHERFFFPHYFYMIDYGGLCMVALDSSFYYYESKVKEMAEQTTWLTRMQKRLKKCDVKVALSHHPHKGAKFPAWKGARGALKGFFELFVIGKFDIHAAGHVHALINDGQDEGTRLLISGTGGEVTEGKPGYIVLSWNPKNPRAIGYTLREIDIAPNVYEAQEEVDLGYAPMIKRSYVEENILTRFWHWIKKIF